MQHLNNYKKKWFEFMGYTPHYGQTKLHYPKKDSAKWNEIYRKRDRRDSYPFTVKNVEEFCKFLENCGGFRIC